jgi:hypothetical protein
METKIVRKYMNICSKSVGTDEYNKKIFFKPPSLKSTTTLIVVGIFKQKGGISNVAGRDVTWYHALGLALKTAINIKIWARSLFVVELTLCLVGCLAISPTFNDPSL